MPIEDSPAASIALNRRNSLRGATDHLRRDLDRIVAAFNLADVTHYRRFLQANAATLTAIEQLLENAGVAQLLPDWPQRARRAAILADLHSLECAVQPLALRRTAPTPAEMFGILYVLEDSRRSAPVLLERVMANSDRGIGNACSYLRHGQKGDPNSDSSAHLWWSFLEQLETNAAADDQTQTVSGAVYAFTMFIRSVTQGANDLGLRPAPAP